MNCVVIPVDKAVVTDDTTGYLRRTRAIPAVHPTRLCVDNEITRMTMDGEVVSQHSLYDILSTEPSLPIESPPEIEASG